MLKNKMSKRIAVTGGKGGIGKSTIATSLAVELAKKSILGKKTLLVDADVDCPNDHLILNINREKVKDVFQSIPKINKKKCKKCNECIAAKVCKEKALIQVKGQSPILIPDQCIGCKACMIACPYEAIEKDKKKIGTVYSNTNKKKNYNIDFFSAETEIGVEEGSPIVNTLKNEIKDKENDYEKMLIDTAPGAHCNVISALQDCETVFSVTDPTPLGAHDLELSLQLLEKLKIPFKIIINRSNIGNKKLIYDIAKKHNTKIAAEIPYSKEVLKAYSEGRPIEDKNIKKLANQLNNEIESPEKFNNKDKKNEMVFEK